MSFETIAIIDYGSGNLRSAAKAFSHVMDGEGLKGEVVVTARAADIARADRIVLPGQGAFGDCIAGLRAIDGMIETLQEKVVGNAAPFLGICVGMQLLAAKGLEFGEHQGLGWIPGTVRKMNPPDSSLKIPHMGWNAIVENTDAPHSVLQGITKNHGGLLPDFYFVHSFMFESDDTRNVAAWCDYGGLFAAIVAKDNIMGTQFHPEKSQQAGLDLIRGFLQWKI